MLLTWQTNVNAYVTAWVEISRLYQTTPWNVKQYSEHSEGLILMTPMNQS